MVPHLHIANTTFSLPGEAKAKRVCRRHEFSDSSPNEMLGPGVRVASRPGGALHQWLSLLEA